MIQRADTIIISVTTIIIANPFFFQVLSKFPCYSSETTYPFLVLRHSDVWNLYKRFKVNSKDTTFKSQITAGLNFSYKPFHS